MELMKKRSSRSQKGWTSGTNATQEFAVKHRMILRQLLSRPAPSISDRNLFGLRPDVAREQVHHPQHLGRKLLGLRRRFSELAAELHLKLILAGVELPVEALVEFVKPGGGPK
jgi:hypothetical protein